VRIAPARCGEPQTPAVVALCLLPRDMPAVLQARQEVRAVPRRGTGQARVRAMGGPSREGTYQVSLAALLMRARTLGRMSESNYLTAVKAAHARGWRRVEPVPLGKPEHPACLKQLLATRQSAASHSNCCLMMSLMR
jgi:hypothetical protein